MNELIYRPQHKPEQELINDFVIRLVEYEKIIKNIDQEDFKSVPQHTILQGMRGMGKTTLMHRVFYQINQNYRDKGLVPVIFSEEQYSVRTLYKLWEEVARYLEDHEVNYAGIWYEMQEAQEHDDYEEECFEILKRHIDQNHNRLVLFIDNFGITVDKFNKHEQQRLREILIEYKLIKIVGGSSVLLESFYKYDKPFFDFFKVIKLEKLNKKEVETLLLRLEAKRGTNKIREIIQDQPGRIESLRILTGGVPRTIVLLFEIFLDDRNGNSIDDLKKLLDDVTPLYKHRMDELPAQQQEIVDKLALNWDGMSVAELAKKTRMESKAVSSQLNNLVKSNVVTSSKSTGKNKFYQLQERFFNIWYLMHHAPRSTRKKVIWLTRFLEIWCNKTLLSLTAKDFVSKMKGGSLRPEYISTMAHAYATVDRLDLSVRDEIIDTANDALSKNTLTEPLPEKYSDLNTKLRELLEQKDFKIAHNTLNKANVSDSAYLYFKSQIEKEQGKISAAVDNLKLSFQKGFIPALNGLGILYYEQNEHQLAIRFYSMAIDKGHVDAMYNLAILYKEQNESELAIKFYSMAIDKGHVDAMYNLGNLYGEQNEFELAIKCYSMAIDKGHAGAMNNLGILYYEQNESELAIKYYRMGCENNDLNALYNLGVLYLELERFSEAHKLLIELIYMDEDGQDYVLPFMTELISKGMIESVYKLFNSEEYHLKDKLKVPYYALMKIMENQYPNEIKKMGKELEEPVMQMVEELKELQVEYAKTKKP